jgi:hypothetical protein
MKTKVAMKSNSVAENPNIFKINPRFIEKKPLKSTSKLRLLPGISEIESQFLLRCTQTEYIFCLLRMLSTFLLLFSSSNELVADLSNFHLFGKVSSKQNEHHNSKTSSKLIEFLSGEISSKLIEFLCD